MEGLKNKAKEHGAVWALVLGLGYGFGDDGIKAFAADVIKDEVNRELKVEVAELKQAQAEQKQSVNDLAAEQRVLAEQIKASNDNMKNLIDVLRSQQ